MGEGLRKTDLLLRELDLQSSLRGKLAEGAGEAHLVSLKNE